MTSIGPRAITLQGMGGGTTQESLEELAAYRDRLRSYSAAELEDIYFNIHVLRHPLRYRLLQIELERRQLLPAPRGAAPPRRLSLVEAARNIPPLARHPVWRAMALASIFFGLSFAVTAAVLTPVWLCAVPWRLRGLQASLVYLVWIPWGSAAGVRWAHRLGASGGFAVAALLGAVAGFAWWASWGAFATIIASLGEAGGAGGGLFTF
ncbi:MAG: hypothetical protein ACP5VE_12120 [Chthonomonadales bacterium]